jgi:hypothetical protein
MICKTMIANVWMHDYLYVDDFPTLLDGILFDFLYLEVIELYVKTYISWL